MPLILDPTNYLIRVRNKLGVLESDLPQEVIDEAVSSVERKVLRKIVDITTLSAEDRDLLEDGVLLLVCSELCQVLKVRIPVREEGPSGRFEIRVDWDELARKFEEDGNSLVGLFEDVPFSGHLILGGPQR